MRHALITVFFVGCMGLMTVHSVAGILDKATQTAVSLSDKREHKPIKINVQGQEMKTSSLTKKHKDTSAVSVSTDGRSRGTIVAVLMLVGAIAIRRIVSIKF